MVTYFKSPPAWLRWYYPQLVWRMPHHPGEKKIYLTFDDGPHPTITPWVLEELKKYKALATFFCIGNNIKKHGDTFQQICDQGHAVANHTFNHPDGWKCSDEDYLKEISTTEPLTGSGLFRPPYGRIKKSQIRLLQQQFPQMKIIMWSRLSADFDTAITGQQALSNLLDAKIQGGDIFLFHDSEKALDRLKVALPGTLQFFSEKGFTFEKINAFQL